MSLQKWLAPGEQVLRVGGAPTIYGGAPMIKGGPQYACAVTCEGFGHMMVGQIKGVGGKPLD